jgi:hypothetical protein
MTEKVAAERAAAQKAEAELAAQKAEAELAAQKLADDGAPPANAPAEVTPQMPLEKASDAPELPKASASAKPKK